MFQRQKNILSNKHKGFEGFLSFTYSGLSRLTDFFFAYLGPLSSINLRIAIQGLAAVNPFLFHITMPENEKS